jgi:hypothetical protein
LVRTWPGQFVLDTVLVVAACVPYTLGQGRELPWPVSEAFRHMAGQPGSTAVRCTATAGMNRYSASPLPGLDGARFPRPALRRSQFVNPDLTQGFKVTASSIEQIQAVWDEVVSQVRDQDLDLAIHLERVT